MPASSPPFTLRPMSHTDAEPVQHLWASRFGGRPSTQKNWIDAALTPSHSAVGFVATARSSGGLVGFSFLDVGSRTYTSQYFGLDTLDLDPPLEDQNGLFHLSCVRADWEGCGIGSAFYDRRLDVLADRDISRAFGIAWHRSHTVDSRVLFEKWGFTSFATIERYYARTGGRANCPDCGDSCSCTASLYARKLFPADRSFPHGE